MVCHTLNPDSSATLPYKYDRYSSPTDMYEKCHLFSSTYLPRLNKGVPPPQVQRHVYNLGNGLFCVYQG